MPEMVTKPHAVAARPSFGLSKLGAKPPPKATKVATAVPSEVTPEVSNKRDQKGHQKKVAAPGSSATPGQRLHLATPLVAAVKGSGSGSESQSSEPFMVIENEVNKGLFPAEGGMKKKKKVATTTSTTASNVSDAKTAVTSGKGVEVVNVDAPTDVPKKDGNTMTAATKASGPDVLVKDVAGDNNPSELSSGKGVQKTTDAQ